LRGGESGRDGEGRNGRRIETTVRKHAEKRKKRAGCVLTKLPLFYC